MKVKTRGNESIGPYLGAKKDLDQKYSISVEISSLKAKIYLSKPGFRLDLDEIQRNPFIIYKGIWPGAPKQGGFLTRRVGPYYK